MPHPFKGELGRAFAWECLHSAMPFVLCLHTFGVTSCVVKVHVNWLPRVILILSVFTFVNEIVLNLFYVTSRHLLHCLYFVHTRQWKSTWRQKCRNAFVLYLDSSLSRIATDTTPATSRMLCSWVGYMALWYPRRRGHGQWGLNWRIVLIHLQENCNWCRGTTVRNKIVRTD